MTQAGEVRCLCSYGHCGCDWPDRPHPCGTCDCCHSFTQRATVADAGSTVRSYASPERKGAGMSGTDDAFRDAGWAAADAYTATPGDHKTRLAAVTAAHLRELAGRGLLACPPPAGGPPTLEEDARWLAEAAGHPRFTGDGWRVLLVAEGDILMAVRCAVDRRPGSPSGFRREHEVRDRLLRNLGDPACNVGHAQ